MEEPRVASGRRVLISAAVMVALVAGAGIALLVLGIVPTGPMAEGAVQSPYAGQETRAIKALSQDDIEGLLAGAGTPFGGMAKPAELNGYPGPRHVLDAADTGAFELTDAQVAEVQALYDAMRAEAMPLGEAIVAIEQEIDDAFVNETVTEALLSETTSESATLYGQLRTVHLKSHLRMVEILTPEQIAQYNELRGYTAGDPCENVPEGHDAELWRQHNSCD